MNEAVSLKQEKIPEIKEERKEKLKKAEEKEEKTAIEMAREAAGRANIMREARMEGLSDRQARDMSRSVNVADAREQGNLKVKGKEKPVADRQVKTSTKKLVAELRRGKSLKVVKQETTAIKEDAKKKEKKMVAELTAKTGNKKALTAKQLDALRRGKSLQVQQQVQRDIEKQNPKRSAKKKQASKEIINARLNDKNRGR